MMYFSRRGPDPVRLLLSVAVLALLVQHWEAERQAVRAASKADTLQ